MHKKNVNLLDEIEGGAIEFNLSLSLLLLFIWFDANRVEYGGGVRIGKESEYNREISANDIHGLIRL